MPPATARQLLTHMKWNVDRLIECYYGGEADALFTKGGIADPRNANSAMVCDASGLVGWARKERN